MRRKVAAFMLAATPFAVGGYVAFQTTFGDTWSHNTAVDDCVATPPGSFAMKNPAAGVGATDRRVWWPPLGYAHHCVYDLPNGRTIVRPLPR